MDKKNYQYKDCPYYKDIEKIGELLTQVLENSSKIDRLIDGDWYSNRELFEMNQDMKEKFVEFNENFRKYNGLLEKYTALENRLSRIETQKQTKDEANVDWREKIAWAVAILSSLFAIAQYI